MTLVQQSADTLLQIDRKGGGDGLMDFVTFRDATTGGVSQKMRGSNLAPAAAAPTDGDDTIEGTPGDDVLDGLKGADTIYGRAGNDRLAGGDGNDRLFGEENDDTLAGGAGDDLLVGGIGNDILDGGAGTDRAEGGAGNDTYYVDSAADVAYELADEGNDLLITRVGYTLGANIERMQAALVGGTDPITLTGNALGNTIWGTFGANVLDGAGGADVMYGYGGNDTYYVDNAGDAAVELANQGTDIVLASVSYTIGANIERLRAQVIGGTDDLALTGNALANTIWANFGNNVINGGGGADVMYGYGGDDSYYVDNAGDAAVELANQGTDIVLASVSYTIGANIENLVATIAGGTAPIALTGNGAANIIRGNVGANVIDGKGGNDTLTGLGGADVFAFTTALDAATNVDFVVDFEAAVDRIRLAVGAGEPFSGLAAGTLSSGAFATGAVATQADDRIIYDAGSGALFYDADGAGGEAAVQFARVGPGTPMTAAQFQLPGVNGAHTITSAATATVAENAPVGQPVYKVTVSDPDGDAVFFSLEGTDAAKFGIDGRTGDIRLLASADFETQSSYQLVARATDSSGFSVTRNLTVTVTDVSDLPAYFISDQEPNNTTGAAQPVDRSRLAQNADPIVPDATLPSATITGSISTGTDKDLFSITLNAGELLILDVDGTDTLDAELVVFGPDGIEVARNDDPGSFDPGSTAHEGLSHNMDSVIKVRAPTTGTYTFQIASFQEESGSTSQGGYTLHVLVGPVATAAQINEENIQSLFSGDSWDMLSVTYGFTTSGSQYGPGEGTDEIAAGMSAMNAVQQAATRNVLAQYANLTNLSFSELAGSPGSAHMRYALSLEPDTAHAYHPGAGNGGDSWYNTNKYNNPTVGNYQWMTFLHETGHALGLKHGHESPALSPDRDSLEFSVMTYRSYIGSSLDDDSGFSNETWGYAQTPMMYDIAALQRLYGADFSFNSDDSVYSWDYMTGAFRINGVTQWAPGGPRVLMTLWDGGGIDTYDLSGMQQFQSTIDLRPGEWTTLSNSLLANLGDGHKARGNVANALLYNGDTRSLIENAIGSPGTDTIIANQAANRLTGSGGNDTFRWASNGDVGLGASADTVTDFTRSADLVDLKGIDAITATAGDDAFTFVGSAAFSATAGQLRFEVVGNQTRLLGDVNGDAVADFAIAFDNLTFLDLQDFSVL